MISLEMLPAAHGDCLWLEYGSAVNPNRVLIDGGPGSCYETLRWRILALPEDQRHFELLVITHVDADHIEGVIKLLQDDDLNCSFDDIWFNDWKQIDNLPDQPEIPPNLGPVQGEFLGALIESLPNQNWNAAFNGKAIFVPDGDSALPSITLAGGLQLTLLSPYRENLEELRVHWDEAVKDAGFNPGDRDEALSQLRAQKRLGPPREDLLGDEEIPGSTDTSTNNGSSIALLAEFDNKRLLLSGDAFPKELRMSLDRWLAHNGEEKLKLDAFKLPHHGSKKNITPQLLELIKCKRYLISTSGARFNHPDSEAVDLILEHHSARGKPRLYFNYHTEDTASWADETDQLTRKYQAFFPEGTKLGLY
jgi:hypothetical protein